MMKVLLVALLISSSNGFLQGSPSTSASSRIRQSTQVTKLPMAGFGGGANASSKKKKTPLKLKPKLQWDRYVSLKHSDKVQVGIRLISESADTPSEWLEVGRIKTKENENIPLAVAIQRAIIAEVCNKMKGRPASDAIILIFVYSIVLSFSALFFKTMNNLAWETFVSFASIEKNDL